MHRRGRGTALDDGIRELAQVLVGEFREFALGEWLVGILRYFYLYQYLMFSQYHDFRRSTRMASEPGNGYRSNNINQKYHEKNVVWGCQAVPVRS